LLLSPVHCDVLLRLVGPRRQWGAAMHLAADAAPICTLRGRPMCAEVSDWLWVALPAVRVLFLCAKHLFLGRPNRASPRTHSSLSSALCLAPLRSPADYLFVAETFECVHREMSRVRDPAGEACALGMRPTKPRNVNFRLQRNLMPE
jgi:hypothetical protein